MLFFQLYIPVGLNGLMTFHKLDFAFTTLILLFEVVLISLKKLLYIFNHSPETEKGAIENNLNFYYRLNHQHLASSCSLFVPVCKKKCSYYCFQERNGEEERFTNFHKSRELRFENKTSSCFLEQSSSHTHSELKPKYTTFLKQSMPPPSTAYQVPILQ